MRIRIWNAFASNNSGSFTIVGTFIDEQRARAVVDELAVVLAEHDRWVHDRSGGATATEPRPADGGESPPSALGLMVGLFGAGSRRARANEESGTVSPSPLRQFAQLHGLNQEGGVGERGDWPEFARPSCPAIASAGSQVLIHSPYTATLPPLFGEYFHKRGGRVELELDHAHAPIAVVFEIQWPWRPEVRARVAQTRAALRTELMAPDGVIAKHAASALPARAWIPDDTHPDLCVAAVFKDLIAGVAETSEVIRRAGAEHHVRLREVDAASAALFHGLQPPDDD